MRDRYSLVARVAFTIAIAITAGAQLASAQVLSYRTSWYTPPVAEPVAIGPDGSLLFCDGLRPPSFYRYDASGVRLAKWLAPAQAIGLAVTDAGDFYAAFPTLNAVLHYSAGGSLIGYLGPYGGVAGSADGQFNQPSTLAIDRLGNLLVGDSGNNRVQKFDATGAFVNKWGSLGSGNGTFSGMTGISTGQDGSVYVVDYNNSLVSKFTADGQFLLQWYLFQALGVAVAPSGVVYVTSQANHLVYAYDANGTALGNVNAQNIHYHGWGIAVDRDGTVYATYPSDDILEVLTPGATAVRGVSWGAVKALYH